jgi:hypothetical protein
MRGLMEKIKEKYNSAMEEIKDLKEEHYRDKEDHLETIRNL